MKTEPRRLPLFFPLFLFFLSLLRAFFFSLSALAAERACSLSDLAAERACSLGLGRGVSLGLDRGGGLRQDLGEGVQGLGERGGELVLVHVPVLEKDKKFLRNFAKELLDVVVGACSVAAAGVVAFGVVSVVVFVFVPFFAGFLLLLLFVSSSSALDRGERIRDLDVLGVVTGHKADDHVSGAPREAERVEAVEPGAEEQALADLKERAEDRDGVEEHILVFFDRD